MPAMTSAELNARKFGELVSRTTHNTEGFEQPAPPPVVGPERIETPPWVAPELPQPFALRRQAGQYTLVKSKGGGQPRAVQESDLEELLMWAVPRFQVRHPRCTVESLLPFLRMAIGANDYKALRTDNCCGLFGAVKSPWEPLPVVFDWGVVGRDDTGNAQQVGFEVLRIYKAALEWAISLKAVEFRIVSDMGTDLEPIAKSLKMDPATILYRKSLAYG